MDRIAAMTAFVRVVEAGTFTRAAATLDLPNATVTRLVQALERDLAVRLLHRTSRAVTVTPEGAAYYERVVRLLADLADIEASARLARGKPSGRIRVDAAAAIATTVIVPALADFRATYPEIEVELGAGNRRVDLVADGIDCVIRAGAVDEQELVARRIGGFRFVTCAAPALVAAHGAPAAPDDLARMPTVGMTLARGARARPFRFARDGVETELAPAHPLVVGDTNAYLAAGLAGLGVIQAPSYAVREALAGGRLLPLLEDWRAAPTPVHLVYAPNRYLGAAARAFIDWTVALFERDAWLREG